MLAPRSRRSEPRPGRPSAIAGALIALAVTACSSAAPAPAPIRNRTPTAAEPSIRGQVDGALWTCQIAEYDPQPCKLSQGPDGWRLTKLLGSQRFTGSIDLVHDSLTGDRAFFVGRYFCPWGDCTTDIDLVLERGPAPDAAYTGTFGGDTISIRYDAALDAAYGGAGYGRLTGDEQ